MEQLTKQMSCLASELRDRSVWAGFSDRDIREMAFADIMTLQLEDQLYEPCRDAADKGNTLPVLHALNCRSADGR